MLYPNPHTPHDKKDIEDGHSSENTGKFEVLERTYDAYLHSNTSVCLMSEIT
jgi:hypothetical protein